MTAGLAIVLFLAAGRAPLPGIPGDELHTGYRISDNRRLFLRYAALLVAILLGPWLAARLSRRTTGPEERREKDPGDGGEPQPESPAGRVAGDGGEAPRPGAPAIPHGPPLRRHPAAVIAIALLMGFLLIGPGVAYRAMNGHEFIHLGYLNEIDHGRLLNVDTRITYGPLLGYSIYAFMKTVSFTIFGFRLFWNVTAAFFLAALLGLALPRFHSRTLFVLFGAYLLLHTVARYYIPDRAGIHGGYWGWGNMARQGWMTVALLLLAERLHRSGAARAPILAGLTAGLAFFYAQETSLPAAGTFAVLILLNREVGPRRRGLELGLLAAGCLAGVFLASLPAILRGRLNDFAGATLHWSGLFLGGAGNSPFPPPVGQGLRETMAGSVYYLVPGAVFLLLLRGWIDWIRHRNLKPPEFGLALYAALSFVTVLAEADTPHLLNVTVAPLTAAFLAIDRFLGRSPPAARRLLPAALLLPLFLFRPGIVDVARGLIGRCAHLNPRPPAGLERLPVDRAGIWTPPENWYDRFMIGKSDSKAGMEMIRRLTGGKPAYIVGYKASAHYFLAGVPSAVPFTDPHSQVATAEDQSRIERALKENRPEYIFISEEYSSAAHRSGRGTPGYRSLGLHHAFYVFQRRDLEPPPDLE